MGIIKLKKYIISTRVGRFIDSWSRYLLSFAPFFHSLVTQKKRHLVPDKFVFFLYGGIGDAVIVLPLINSLALNFFVVVFCDKRISNLSFLLSENVKVVIYDKNNLLSFGGGLRKHIVGSHPVFVQISPIIEMYIVRLLLGVPYAIGLISDFSNIRSIGFYLKPCHIDSHSRGVTYKKIYELISDNFYCGNVAINYAQIASLPVQNVSSDFCLNCKYIVISPSKSAQWEMGKMPDDEYVKLADYIAKRYKYKIVFIGDHSETERINNMLSLSSEASMMVNMAGRTSLESLASIILCSEFVVANDNGVSHLSSYLGVKTIVLFMFSDPNVYEWEHKNYACIFNKIDSCMPCVGRNRFPQDNYPVLCKKELICNTSITFFDIIKKINLLGWL